MRVGKGCCSRAVESEKEVSFDSPRDIIQKALKEYVLQGFRALEAPTLSPKPLESPWNSNQFPPALEIIPSYYKNCR